MLLDHDRIEAFGCAVDSRSEARGAGTDDRDVEASVGIERDIDAERVAEFVVGRVLQRREVRAELQNDDRKLGACDADAVSCKQFTTFVGVGVVETCGHAVAIHLVA